MSTLKILQIVVVGILTISCNHKDQSLFIEPQSGLVFKFDHNAETTTISTQITSMYEKPNDIASINNHFSNKTEYVYILQDKDTAYSLDVHLEKYYNAVPYDIVSYSFYSKAFSNGTTLIINDPMLFPKKLTIDLSNIDI